MSNGAQGNRSDENQSERIDRELIELLNELRVALPGVQVLFAFLLTVPFSQGFVKTTQFQRDLLFGVLAATAISAALLIAPSAWHRLRFRQRDKEAFSETLTVVSGIAAALVFGGLWYTLPLAWRVERTD